MKKEKTHIEVFLLLLRKEKNGLTKTLKKCSNRWWWNKHRRMKSITGLLWSRATSDAAPFSPWDILPQGILSPQTLFPLDRWKTTIFYTWHELLPVNCQHYFFGGRQRKISVEHAFKAFLKQTRVGRLNRHLGGSKWNRYLLRDLAIWVKAIFVHWANLFDSSSSDTEHRY